MKLPPHRRDRYLRDPLPIRLGGLAANLARVASFAPKSPGPAVVDSLLYESKYFIEWSAPAAPIEVAAVLVELQLELARWQDRWSKTNSDAGVQQEIAQFARDWSDRLLEMSGLLAEPGIPPA